MVYCGKPSQACGPCRAKKTRCDKARPSCSQCLRTKTQCEGYRDDSETLFRNQTDAVISRAQATTTRADHKALVRAQKTSVAAKARAAGLLSSSSSATKPMPWTDLLMAPPPSLCAHADDVAGMAFYKQFLANGLAPGKDGFGLVPSVYVQAAPSSGLRQLMTALGLAAHPAMRHDADVQLLARRRYARALALTNRALGDESARLRDDTLMTIILLAMYELVTGADRQSIGSWTAHVNGAIDLLVLRGEQQFKSTAGVAMFTHMRSRIYISCIQRCVPIPDALLKLSRKCFAYQSEEEVKASKLLDIVAEFSRLQHKIAIGAIADLDEICTRLYEVDARQKAWIDNMPESYQRTRIIDQDNKFACDGYYDLYASKFVALIRNNASVIRIILGQTLRKYLREYPGVRSGLDEEIEIVNEMVRQESAEICANLPFLMGDVQPLNGKQVAPNLYGYSNLAWILYPIISDLCGYPKTRQWCFQLLLRVSETAGLQQTKVLAYMARQDVTISDYTGRREMVVDGSPLAALSLNDGNASGSGSGGGSSSGEDFWSDEHSPSDFSGAEQTEFVPTSMVYDG